MVFELMSLVREEVARHSPYQRSNTTVACLVPNNVTTCASNYSVPQTPLTLWGVGVNWCVEVKFWICVR